MKWYSIAVSICISLMANVGEHLFRCLLAICISLEKCLFRSFVHILIGFFTFLLLSCNKSLYILDRGHFSDILFPKIFSHSEMSESLFTFLTAQKFKMFIVSLSGKIVWDEQLVQLVAQSCKVFCSETTIILWMQQKCAYFPFHHTEYSKYA